MHLVTGRVFLVLTFLLAVLPTHSLAEDDLSRALQDILEGYHAANPGVPGVVVQVSSPSLGLEWAAAVGTDGANPASPLQTGHTFRIASNTKTYVAAAVLRLVELEKLGLDDPLGPHLSPAERELLAGDGYDLEAMTIAQVLAHTSGLAEHPADPRYEEAILADPHHRWTPLEQVTACVEWTDPVGPPGGPFSYSDTGYILLGGIIERLTEQPLGPAVRELLRYDELGFEATWWEIFEEPPGSAGPRAHQYYGELDTYDWDPSLDLYGGGGLISDVREMGLFIRLLLEGHVLQDDSLKEMTERGTADYKLGIFRLEFGDHLAWGHSGFWNTFAYYVPELDLTVSGCILNHHAEKGWEMARRMVEAAATGNP
jgi:D-alanyl-D-alanine carboxypeptidase